MSRPFRQQVFELLAAGRTVAQVCSLMAAPRAAVVRVGAEAGMRFVPGRDQFVYVGKAVEPRDLLELVTRGEASTRRRTQALAVRVRTMVAELERCVLADESAAAQRSYPIGHVRQWAREQGLDVPDRGRYLPGHVVQAWRDAGEP